MGVVVVIVVVVGVLVMTALLLAWGFQDWILYMPRVPGAIYNRDPNENQERSLRSPKFYNWEYDEVFIDTATPGVRLHAWIIYKLSDGLEPRNLPTVLFMHGNAGNIGHRLPFAEVVMLYSESNIMLVDYRGFGLSTGSPSEEGLIEDAQCALEYLQKCPDIDPDRIFLHGRSLGGAVCIGVANRLAALGPATTVGFRGLILENTFLSVRQLVKDRVQEIVNTESEDIRDMCDKIVDTFVWLDWDSASRITALPEGLDVLFISGSLDEIIPCDHMTKLYALAGPNISKSMLRVPLGDHNFSWGRLEYSRGLHSFLYDVCAK
mmetsp:Transcript_19986/g.39256  ORF Transcript_19986/g.39256 Transcript_19986/m.39256 type:complete len:321 (-) Transcript_19986:137-1099(-)